MKTIHLQIPADADYIDVVRICLLGVATKLGFSFEEIEDLKVAASEACSNAVLHRMESGADVIDIAFEPSESALTVSVVNYGASFDHEAARDSAAAIEGGDRSELRVGGLGLYLMEALMDKVEMSSGEGKTEVRLTKYRS
ncbi:ATP-binding protein [Paenibacillus sp. GCM10027627]|uniref:ATP-binding protein n=1 Tax=unclassified Paenibacillus TaxID=185978 RepID=UPI0036250C66